MVSCLILFSVGRKQSYVNEFQTGLGTVCAILGIIVIISSIIVLCCLLTTNVKNNKKKNHVDMLVEENARIEQQVDTIVRNYCQHENDIYTELIGENVMFVITIYPKLASSEIVNKQIDLYVSNNEEIKKLKAELIYAGTIRFWLYFGN